jgi:IclR family acetate operon transcriptional repressor
MLREHVSRRATHPPQDSVSRGVQSVSRAISLIASLVEADAGLTLSELARSAGLSMSTTHRLLRSLCDGEILCRDLVTERFIPGPLLMRLARSSIFNGGFAEASHILQGLTDRTRETASYGVRDGDSVLVLLAVQSPEPLRFERQLGSRLALHSSALGRALLAHGPESAEDALAALAPLTATTTQTQTETTSVLNAIHAVRYRGWAWVEEEHDVGVHAVAAPIRVDKHTAHAAVALEAPSSRITRERIELFGRELSQAAGLLRRLPISMADMKPMHPANMPPGMLG